MSLGKNNPQVRAQIDIVTTVSPSLVERFGLFTIIVLGEVVVGVVGGATEHHHLTWLVEPTAILGMLVAIGLWWVYFDFISHRLPNQVTLMVSEWFYLHLPLTMGVATVGVSVFYLVAHAREPLLPEVRWLMVFAMAVTLLSVALLTRTIQLNQVQQSTHRIGRRVMLVSAALSPHSTPGNHQPGDDPIADRGCFAAACPYLLRLQSVDCNARSSGMKPSMLINHPDNSIKAWLMGPVIEF